MIWKLFVGRAISHMETLIDADENEGFGPKSMRPGFTNDSSAKKSAGERESEGSR